MISDVGYQKLSRYTTPYDIRVLEKIYINRSLPNQYYRYLKRQMVPTQTTKILQCRCKNLVLRKFDDI